MFIISTDKKLNAFVIYKKLLVISKHKRLILSRYIKNCGQYTKTCSLILSSYMNNSCYYKLQKLNTFGVCKELLIISKDEKLYDFGK